MKIARPYLLLFVPIYGLITYLRNVFYDMGLFKSTWFNQPIIVVGNLSMGGTGKTPHVAFLLKKLSSKYKTATLSRGYGRQSTGFLVADNEPDAKLVGDEPAQLKCNFPELTVAVDADRVNGIQKLNALNPKPDIILLDDAFQHRRLQAGYYILLTTYQQPYFEDALLPAGNLREMRGGAARAHCIVVTKCPPNLSQAQRDDFTQKIKPLAHQSVYFTQFNYQKPVGPLANYTQWPFLLVTGIAKSQPLLDFLHEQHAKFSHLEFADHHDFTEADVEKMISIASQEGFKHILTTEKDFQRLPTEKLLQNGLLVSYLPINVAFQENENQFLSDIEDFIQGF